MVDSSRHNWAESAWWLLRLMTAAALAVDAYVHADLITRYDPNQADAAISQGDLFRIEVVVATVAAIAVVLAPRRVVWVFALLVASSALGGVLLYRYFNPGALGPLPDMYEPIWYPQKSLAVIAESAAVAASLLGYLMTASMSRRQDRNRHPSMRA